MNGSIWRGCLVAAVVFSAVMVASGETASAGKLIDHIALTVNPRILNPVREKSSAGKMTLTAFYADGSQRVLKPSVAVITVRSGAGFETLPRDGG